MFYYLLANIRLVFWSTLPSIELLAIARAGDIHSYGCKELLEPFVTPMKELGQAY